MSVMASSSSSSSSSPCAWFLRPRSGPSPSWSRRRPRLRGDMVTGRELGWGPEAIPPFSDLTSRHARGYVMNARRYSTSTSTALSAGGGFVNSANSAVQYRRRKMLVRIKSPICRVSSSSVTLQQLCLLDCNSYESRAQQGRTQEAGVPEDTGVPRTLRDSGVSAATNITGDTEPLGDR